MMIIDNVDDRRRGRIDSWVAEPLVFEALTMSDVGRTVIYLGYGGRAEAGTLTSWRDGAVFARYSQGDTAAGASARDIVFGIRALDTPAAIMAAHMAARVGSAAFHTGPTPNVIADQIPGTRPGNGSSTFVGQTEPSTQEDSPCSATSAPRPPRSPP